MNLGNLSSKRSNGNGSPVESLGTDGVSHREGGRVRAWREALECVDSIENEGGDLSDLRAKLIAVRDGAVTSPSTTGKVSTRPRHYVGITSAGNRIYQYHTGDTSVLKALFTDLYSFAKKEGALYVVDNGVRDEDQARKVW